MHSMSALKAVRHAFQQYTLTVFLRPGTTLAFLLRRYKAAGQMRAPAERKFEGIKLESGPNVPNAPGSSLSICEACYYDEESRHA
eukprot:scaffold162147_cov25-Tisochrysis_lutea.AAC.1